jgi:hypothetical protein
MSETDVSCDLFLHWLSHEYGRRFVTSGGADYSDGQRSLAIEVRPLLENGGEAWQRRRARLETAIAEGLPAHIALWVPAGADLPDREPSASKFIDAVRQAAVRLGPRERSYVPLPITLRLRKSSGEGGVVSVSGGLNPYWARFTDRVNGAYDLDSTQLHRLPESREHLEDLINQVVAASESLELAATTAVNTIDAWTVQRLEGDGGVTIIGVPPEATQDAGLAVRRSFRRVLMDAGPRLREATVDVRALAVVGYYGRVEQEGATTAMRGYDPALYRGIDFVCVVTDGLVKPMIHPPAGAGWDPVAERMGIGGDQ